METRQHKRFGKKDYGSFVLGCDAGGTNTSIGIFGVKKRPELLVSFHFKSKELKGLHEAINSALKKTSLPVSRGCIAGAGVVSAKKDRISITKLDWSVSKKELIAKTGLRQIVFLNDFEAIGYGISMLKRNDLAVVKKAAKANKFPVVVIGAGTGMGKSILAYSEHCKSYLPLASEGGHCEFPAQTKQELELIEFIKRRRKIRQNIGYELIASGQGLVNIYDFLKENKKIRGRHAKDILLSEDKPEMIARYRKTDRACKMTFQIFRDAYAKFARNCALDALCYGGLYIAGGIAAKNPGIFGSAFVRIFENDYERSSLLKKIPIYLILNRDVGMLGAGFAAATL